MQKKLRTVEMIQKSETEHVREEIAAQKREHENPEL